MSTLRVDNLQSSDGLKPSVAIEDVTDKANFVWDHSTDSVKDSFNISALTDGGAGIFDSNFTNFFAFATYGWTAGMDGVNSYDFGVHIATLSAIYGTASITDFRSFKADNPATAIDSQRAMVRVYGGAYA